MLGIKWGKGPTPKCQGSDFKVEVAWDDLRRECSSAMEVLTVDMLNKTLAVRSTRVGNVGTFWENIAIGCSDFI